MPRFLESPSGEDLIDLHAHTSESDGTFTPAEILELAQQIGLKSLAITDHDTMSGYEKAVPLARQAGFDLVCGIELNARLQLDNSGHRQAIHMLAYFPNGEPGTPFTVWLEKEREERKSRNRKLADALQSRGVEITVEEVERRGRTLTGRPHFARVLIEKGYARTYEEAFHQYLSEGAPSFVHRESKQADEVVGIVREAGGVPVIAHPIRLHLSRDEERQLLIRLKRAGLTGLEIYHSEHPPELQAYYRQLAEELELLPTGGSDFHGAVKPDIRLGTGMNGNIRVPASFLEAMRGV